ncbi:MAG: AbrB/MazE/SpoVT family DNA-binding domain-containing protein [Beijerinckiaceae bacterium]
MEEQEMAGWALHLTGGGSGVCYGYETRSFAIMTKAMENINMALMRVRRLAQLTLPAEVRRALNVQEGDYLEARIVKGGVLLKPVAMVERKRAWEGILHATSQVRDLKSDPSKSNKEEEEEIAESIKEFRRKKRKHA